jgi:CubicO group peptidase (beta-lactamase class C family)
VDIELDPTEAGMDPARLTRIDDYLTQYVDDGRVPGWQLVLTRRGKVVHESTAGMRHRENGTPIGTDSLFRIYSMTKPITSVAAMMLYERGAFQLSDPVAKYIPSFADVRVYSGGSDRDTKTAPAVEPVRMRHLLSHTAGLTYGFFRQHPVDALYRANGLDTGIDGHASLADFCDRVAGIPLLFQPGSEWAYSMATDVLGRVVEVLSEQTLGEFFADEVFAPLGMTDTRFAHVVGPEPRLARLYAQSADGLVPGDKLAEGVEQADFEAGGAGLVSSARDYHRFTQMLLRGGELDGQRLLGPRTVAFMASNHLPGNVDLDHFGRAMYSETPMRGVGFGLGFSVNLDPPAIGRPAGRGAYGWGGVAGTRFWVDPAEELTAMFFTQVFTLTPLPIREMLPQMVYQALVD